MSVQVIHIYRERSDIVSRPASGSFFFHGLRGWGEGNWEPNVDIYETTDEVIIRAELAGVSREDVQIRVKPGRLIISGERRPPQSGEGTLFHQIEIKCGSFSKIIPMPSNLEHNEIEARLVDGMLEIRISKREQVIEIPIEVKSVDME